MISIFSLELLTAPPAAANVWLAPVFAAAMGIESRRAIRADDSQILDPVVIRNAVDVVEDQSHGPAAPIFVLTTHLAEPLLYPLGEESPLEI
ncbi:MAG TPA: hypothetical protein VFN18_04610 [Solirubrobacterales bacterium]|nr:hypothetical protein [Solirubrobacterales bacterium]